ncbi:MULTISPECIES: ribosome maturation factor RimP [unclassified Lebetimonas]|uniref:ribosome maturation factor RimP n=1 Tax=unclassified Lebetimonas TaxID=2648158 RepID=UPI00046353A8|nr:MULTISPECIES: ribosome maturation factor RimP [unclassified Lebetimonas]
MNNLKEIIEKTVKNYGCDLYDVEITEEGGHKYFRIYITKPGGVNLNDCEAINNMLSPIFDVEEPIKERYFLEVSSPGLERKLTKKEHFEKSIGENVKVTTNEGKKIKGTLKSFDGDVAEIGKEKVKFEDIKKAKTYVDWNNYKGLK